MTAKYPDWQRTLLRLGLAIVIVGAIAPFVVTAIPSVAGAEHSFVVTSASMEPAIDVGSVVLVESVAPTTIDRGDVITFRVERGQRPITHRVTRVEEGGPVGPS
jgi:signal peptidase